VSCSSSPEGSTSTPGGESGSSPDVPDPLPEPSVSLVSGSLVELPSAQGNPPLGAEPSELPSSSPEDGGLSPPGSPSSSPTSPEGSAGPPPGAPFSGLVEVAPSSPSSAKAATGGELALTAIAAAATAAVSPRGTTGAWGGSP